jgi:hypothetical protein
LVAVSVTHVLQFVYVSVLVLSPTLWHRAVPIHTFFFFIVRGHSPSPALVRFICTIAILIPPGICFRRSTRGWLHLPVPSLFSVSCRLLAATITAATFASVWANGHPPLRLKASARVIHRYHGECSATSVLLSIRQLHYNHCPYSELAILKVILDSFSYQN